MFLGVAGGTIERSCYSPHYVNTERDYERDYQATLPQGRTAADGCKPRHGRDDRKRERSFSGLRVLPASELKFATRCCRGLLSAQGQLEHKRSSSGFSFSSPARRLSPCVCVHSVRTALKTRPWASSGPLAGIWDLPASAFGPGAFGARETLTMP